MGFAGDFEVREIPPGSLGKITALSGITEILTLFIAIVQHGLFSHKLDGGGGAATGSSGAHPRSARSHCLVAGLFTFRNSKDFYVPCVANWTLGCRRAVMHERTAICSPNCRVFR